VGLDRLSATLKHPTEILGLGDVLQVTFLTMLFVSTLPLVPNTGLG
jgi:hypothetical protein